MSLSGKEQGGISKQNQKIPFQETKEVNWHLSSQATYGSSSIGALRTELVDQYIHSTVLHNIGLCVSM